MDDKLKQKLKNLLDYQKKDLELRKLNATVERDPSRVEMNRNRKAFNDAKSALDECEAQAGAILGSYAELIKYIEENESTLAELENIETQTESDIEARVKKLDSYKSKFTSAEKKARDMDEKSHAVIRTRSDAFKSGNAAKKKFAEARDKHNALVESKSGDLNKLKTELEALRKTLDEHLFDEYRKLVEENKFPPVVPASADDKKGMFNCGGCGLGLPQQGNSQLKERGWCRCDNCHRIIVRLN